MSGRYFATPRREVLPHLPARLSRMLDVGCGSGATVAAIKAVRPVAWAGGVERVATEAERAAAVCERVWCLDVERECFEAGIAPASLDLVLCLDVLEHLADPWDVVRRLSPLLAPGGRLIVSVPNVRNWKFLWGLAARGDFHYRDSGLLDRTHLRFFVRETAVDLVGAGGLRVLAVEGAQPWRGLDARRLLSLASLGRLDDFMVKQWLIVAEAAGCPA